MVLCTQSPIFVPSVHDQWSGLRFELTHPKESFSYSVDRTLFQTKLLDSKKPTEPLRSWDCHRHRCGADKLWQNYLVFRCRDKQDESVACYVGIRNTVDFIVPHLLLDAEDRNDSADAPDWDGVLDEVCWLAMGCTNAGNCMRYYGGRWQALSWGGKWTERLYGPSPVVPSNTWLMMFSVATYLGLGSLVKEFLVKGHNPTMCDGLFPSPMYIAAWTGQSDMLLLFQEHLPEFEERQVSSYGYTCTSRTWSSKIGPGSL